MTAETVHTAAPQILAALSDSLGWGLGALWTVDREHDRLRCASVWHADGIDGTAFEAASRSTTFPLGTGIPGRAWAEGGPIWIDDVAAMGRSDRIRNTAEIGLHAAFALPIVLEGGALGVIEFFSRSPRKHDAALLKLMGAVGNQLAQFMQRIQIESDAHISEQRFHALAAGPVGLWHTDAAGETLFVNPAMCHMLGVERQSDLATTTIAEFLDPGLIQPGQSCELELTGRDGSRRHAIMSEAPLQGVDGGSGGTLHSFVDVTELRVVTDKLDFLARNDPLTELPNLAMFTEHLELALHRAVRYGTSTAVLYVDVDEFSLSTKDSAGRSATSCCSGVAERLRAVTRKADVVGRQAGDEFLVLLADMESTEGGSPSGRRRGRRIRRRARAPRAAGSLHGQRQRGLRRRLHRGRRLPHQRRRRRHADVGGPGGDDPRPRAPAAVAAGRPPRVRPAQAHHSAAPRRQPQRVCAPLPAGVRHQPRPDHRRRGPDPVDGSRARADRSEPVHPPGRAHRHDHPDLRLGRDRGLPPVARMARPGRAGRRLGQPAADPVAAGDGVRGFAPRSSRPGSSPTSS